MNTNNTHTTTTITNHNNDNTDDTNNNTNSNTNTNEHDTNTDTNKNAERNARHDRLGWSGFGWSLSTSRLNSLNMAHFRLGSFLIGLVSNWAQF